MLRVITKNKRAVRQEKNRCGEGRGKWPAAVVVVVVVVVVVRCTQGVVLCSGVIFLLGLL